MGMLPLQDRNAAHITLLFWHQADATTGIDIIDAIRIVAMLIFLLILYFFVLSGDCSFIPCKSGCKILI